MRRTVSGLDTGALFGGGRLVSTVMLRQTTSPFTERGARNLYRTCAPKSELGGGILCHCGIR
jgi:hypothetical protein